MSIGHVPNPQTRSAISPEYLLNFNMLPKLIAHIHQLHILFSLGGFAEVHLAEHRPTGIKVCELFSLSFKFFNSVCLI